MQHISRRTALVGGLSTLAGCSGLPWTSREGGVVTLSNDRSEPVTTTVTIAPPDGTPVVSTRYEVPGGEGVRTERVPFGTYRVAVTAFGETHETEATLGDGAGITVVFKENETVEFLRFTE